MDQNVKREPVTQKAEELLQAFKKGAEFTQELLKENERLRFQLLHYQQGRADAADLPGLQAELAGLRSRVQELEAEKQAILQRIAQVEAENLDFANRYVEIEAENNSLANLYIATYQLHSTLDLREVLRIITEILINLIGAEEFALLLLDEKSMTLQAVAAEGLTPEDMPAFGLNQAGPGQVAHSGESFFVDDISTHCAAPDRPLACIPLKIKDRVIGVIAIYKLLLQKSRFAEIDFELFSLLAGHAATAVFAAKLYSESERKLSTIQSFLDLLTK